MSPVIRVTDSIYDRLECHAKGFSTPTSVIEMLLDHYEDKAPSVAQLKRASQNHAGTKDYTQYQFNGATYGKGRLVLAVVKQHVTDKPGHFSERLTGIP